MLLIFVLTDANEATYPIGSGSNLFIMIDRFKLYLAGRPPPPPPSLVTISRGIGILLLFVSSFTSGS